jgi:hypothetical protein
MISCSFIEPALRDSKIEKQKCNSVGIWKDLLVLRARIPPPIDLGPVALAANLERFSFTPLQWTSPVAGLRHYISVKDKKAFHCQFIIKGPAAVLTLAFAGQAAGLGKRYSLQAVTLG